jgi:UDP-glucose 4-epimerase
VHVLVTGGAGYIGSHTVLELLQAGHTVSVVDSLVNGSAESLRRVEAITGKSVPFYQFDLRDSARLSELFAANRFDGVVHFAGLKAVGESVQQPLRYYQNNLESTLSLCEAMQTHGVKTIIFSSSATVYKQDEPSPWTEQTPAGVGIGSPYGRTKYMIEEMLRDFCVADPSLRVTVLRYFNPTGAHPSGRIGEDPSGTPNNLFPFIAQVAVGKRPELSVFGDDYDTPDGTCVRDYIHVVDLAKGHVAALEHSTTPSAKAFDIFNLGAGKGTSVFEAIHAFEQVSGKKIPYVVAPRRAGDAPIYYADPAKANAELGWKTELSVADACRDTWNWQSKNPEGYNR